MLYQDYKDDGLMVIHLLGANSSGAYGEGIPTVAEVKVWADTYGMTFPVVADENYLTAKLFAPGGWNTPSWHLIAPGGEVLITNAANEISPAEIEAALP